MTQPWLAIVSVAVVLATLALSTAGGARVVPVVLRAAGRRSAAEEAAAPVPPPPDPAADPAGPQARAALRGGTWIGLLERLAVTGCVLAGFPAGVAVVVAVKGLGRYPELKENPSVSERFVVGTLASLVWAAGLGYGGWVLLGHLR